MKIMLLFLSLLLLQAPIWANRITFAEEWYNLYHLHLHRYPENEFDNLVFLERALAADFSNPLYALARVTTAQEWQLYRYLFSMHVNLQIVRTYMAIANKYDRRHVYFYNAPWRDANLRSLDIAETYYRRAFHFWNEALRWVELLNQPSFRWMHLTDVNRWHNELARIRNGQLNFELILNRHLVRLEENRQLFLAMDESTY